MAIYLDEDEVGSDAQTIGYPHLLLCMGVTVVMDDGALFGAHVSNATTEQNVLGQLVADITRHGGTMTQLYCAANVGEHVGRHHCLDITGKANALGFHGTAYQFDFSYLNPRDGAYFEVTSHGGGVPCTLRFKRNEKISYTNTGGGTQATKATKDFYGRAKTYAKPTNTVAIAPKAKKFLGIQYGHHHIRTVAVEQLTTVDV